VVSWADRIAYVCHDFEDAVLAGIVTPAMLPDVVAERCGRTRSRQLNAFIQAMVTATATTGRIGMTGPLADALAEFRRFNYSNIYMRPASRAQSELVIRVLRSLVDFYADRPNTLPFDDLPAQSGPRRRDDLAAGSPEAVREAVTYVAGMTDRFACQTAVSRLGWDPAALPVGVDVRPR
jgi:dGTPase